MHGDIKKNLGLGSPYFSYIEMRRKDHFICVLYECQCQREKKLFHHPDYNQTDLVVRLCYSCHVREHIRLGSYKSGPLGNYRRKAITP